MKWREAQGSSGHAPSWDAAAALGDEKILGIGTSRLENCVLGCKKANGNNEHGHKRLSEGTWRPSRRNPEMKASHETTQAAGLVT